jgi:hypothetical protein
MPSAIWTLVKLILTVSVLASLAYGAKLLLDAVNDGIKSVQLQLSSPLALANYNHRQGKEQLAGKGVSLSKNGSVSTPSCSRVSGVIVQSETTGGREWTHADDESGGRVAVKTDKRALTQEETQVSGLENGGGTPTCCVLGRHSLRERAERAEMGWGWSGTTW